ncbi:psbP domain-containing protein 3, chloroplastic-like isoform X1 [Salvia splendens]|uniref:psbP domain-containing protein 3, chloroplastic-like isoform X1 n=1 Tax=Salvia splendens TaxID=180675 RepID=UPI001C25E16A|nr:psbP domain-containing protein 3, chloroplastic-like isoform X1 [Salvia splendens]
MAPIFSLHSHSLLSHPSFSLPNSTHQDNRKSKSTCFICCKSNAVDQQTQCVSVGDECKKRRRELLVQAAASVFAFPAISAAALAAESALPEGFRVYTDEVNKFKITIPEDWQVGTGEGDGVRALIAFYPQEASSSNVSIAITGLGADFTRLESFGKVGEFAETLIGGLDRSWQRPPGVAAKLIDSRASNGLYYIEYTLKNPGESGRHLYSVLGVANNGIYNRLYTLTGQFVDEEEEKFGPKIQKAVSSFRLS